MGLQGCYDLRPTHFVGLHGLQLLIATATLAQVGVFRWTAHNDSFGASCLRLSGACHPLRCCIKLLYVIDADTGLPHRGAAQKD